MRMFVTLASCSFIAFFSFRANAQQLFTPLDDSVPPQAAPPPPPAPPPPAAQEPAECVTTTTTRCTGAAAPYAVPGAVQPAPAAAPAATVRPTVLVVNLKHDDDDDGWRIVQHRDGTMWQEREISTAQPAVWGTGLAMFIAGWLTAGVYSLSSQADGNVTGLGFLPVLGSFINAATVSSNQYSYDSSCYSGYGCDSSSSNAGTRAFYVIDGLVQAAGFVMLLVGQVTGPKRIESRPLTILPNGIVGRF